MPVQLSEQDLDLLRRYPDVPIIDTSDRRDHRHCLSYWDFVSRLRQGYQAKSAAPALAFGTAIHEALDECYAEEPRPDYAVLTRIWDKHLVEKYGLDPEAAALGRAMLEEYAGWAPPLDDFEVVATEHAGLVPITRGLPPDYTARVVPAGEPIRFEALSRQEVVGLYYFRTDGVVRDDRGRLWVLEHKTTGEWWSPAKLALDDQTTSYIWAEQQHFGEPIQGVLMNFLLKKPVKDPPLLKSGKPTADRTKLTYVTAERYGDAFEHWNGDGDLEDQDRMLKELERRGHPTLRRELVERTPFQVAQQGERILAEFLEMTRPGKPIYPTSDKHCAWCPFSSPCLARESGADPSFALEAVADKRADFLGLDRGVHYER